MYTETKCAVLYNGRISRYFSIYRQGSSLSSKLYLLYINDLLEQHSMSRCGVMILDIHVSSPVQAEDIALISTNNRDIHKMVNICENYSYVWKFKLNPSKSIQLNFGGHPQNKDIILNNSLIPVQSSAKHVGVLLSSKLNSVERTMQACRTFRSSALGLMKSGLHSSVASVELCSRVVR